MKKIYLINKQDRYCPENNNGDYIVAAYSNEERAEQEAIRLDKEDPSAIHFVHEMRIEDQR